jgi:hypothetical protein
MLIGSWLVPKPLLYIGAAVLLLGTVFMIGRCTGNDNELEAQVEQTTRSGEAYADAAEMAIDQIGAETATDAAIDAAVADTVGRIEGAQDAETLRNTVIQALCSMPSHRNDPACVPSAETRR